MRKINKTATIIATTLLTLVSLSGCDPTARSHEFNIDITLDTRGATIELWTGFGNVINTELEPMLEDFTALTGINVEYEPKGGYDGLQQAINLSATSTTYPHIANGYPDHFAGYIASDIILRLDGFIENDHLIPETRDALEEGEEEFVELPKLDITDFYPAYFKENQELEYDREGNPYTLGLPFNKSTEVAVINRTAFDLFIHLDPTIKVPETWDEVEAVSTKIRGLMESKGYYGKVVGNDYLAYTSTKDMPTGVKQLISFTEVSAESFRVLSVDSQANQFITGVRQWGGTYTEMDKVTRKGYIKFNSDETRNYLTRMRELFDGNHIGIPQTWEETNYCSGPFKEGKSLMNIGSSGGVVNGVPQANAFQIEAQPVPYQSADSKYVISQGTNLALFDRGTDVEKVAAWKLLKYLAQIVNGEFTARTGYYPTGPGAFESEYYQDYYNSTVKSANDKIKISAAKVNSDVYDDETLGWKKFVDPGFVGSSYIRQEVDFIISELFFGTPRKSVQEIIDYYYDLLGDYVA
ncbi:MAG: extracellular solute-binding protein [Bacilli bacterium]|jgi:multiple sugar transport system substrate-binding protein|nr:extracellular solute-binding protein [Bacilli bacterium]NLN80571.1 extracellular solute-binding protein [Erysipelotrichia bacterium]